MSTPKQGFQGSDRAPINESPQRVYDQLWQKCSDLDARVSRLTNLLNSNANINQILKATAKINGHTSEMPDTNGQNTDHDQRYVKRSQVASIRSYPADTVADLDGAGAAGTSSLYSRGDHKHTDSARHGRQHAITSTSDHTSAATAGALLKADTNGLPVAASAAEVALFHTHGILGGVSHYTNFDATGHQTMVGNARPWRDQLTDALNLQRNGTGISLDISEGALDFASNAAYNATFTLSDAAFANVQLNHDRDLTSLVYPHIHWFQAKNYSPNFLLEYRWQINGGAKTTAWTKLVCNTLAHTYTSGTIHQISYAAGITPPVGTALSDIIQFRVYRDTTNASTEFAGVCPYNTGGNASALVLSFDVHFQMNSIGSTDEYTK